MKNRMTNLALTSLMRWMKYRKNITYYNNFNPQSLSELVLVALFIAAPSERVFYYLKGTN